MNLTTHKNESRLACFVTLVLVSIFMTNVSHGLAHSLGFNSELVTVVLKCIVGISFLSILNIVLSRIDRKLFIFLVLTLLTVAGNVVFFPELNEYFIDNAILFFTLCLLPSVACYILNDYSLLYKYLVAVSYFIAVVMFVVLICLISGVLQSFNDDRYSMGLGYSCQIPTILLSGEASKRNRMAAFGFIVLVLSILMLGSRGPILGIGLFYFYFSIRKLVQSGEYVKAMTVALAFVGVLFVYKPVLKNFNSYLESKDIHSRSIHFLTQDEVHLSNRDILYDTVIDGIKNAPFKIRGINADYVILGGYTHNIILELVYQFGIVFGSVALFFIFNKVWKTLAFKDLDNRKTLCLVFMFASVPATFFTGTLFGNHVFWMWMAIYSKIITRPYDYNSM